MRRHLPLVLAAVALALAVGLTLLARDVSRWEQSMQDGDRSFRVAPGPNGLWEPQQLALGGLSRSLLDVDDDLVLREAAQLFRRSKPRKALRRPEELAIATATRVAFEQIRAGDYSARFRSIAQNQIGILTLTALLADTSEAAVLSKAAVNNFTQAVRLDPANQAAHANLELMLTLLRTDDPRVVPEEESARGGGSASGAGSGTGGSGF
jgi:hypothetical protein